MIDFIENEGKAIERRIDRINYLEKWIRNEKAAFRETKARLENTLKAQEVLQHLAQAVQQKAHEKISRVVSSCLAAVFGDRTYQFQIEFERKRGKTEAKLRFVRGLVSLDPLSASGGGVVDVAAFALRIACLVLHRPRLRQVVILDEPFKHVSEVYQDNVRLMMEQLSADMKIQIVFVTHNNAYATGKIIEL